MTPRAVKKVTVDLPVVDPKKNSVRYDAAAGDKDAAVQSVYVMRSALAKIGGGENGIRVTIEAL